MKTLIKLVNGQEISRKEYFTEQSANDAGNSWLRDCTVHAEIRKERSIEITDGMFIIRNTKTDQTFDTNDMKFYGSNWEPEFSDDKVYLETIISNNPENFIDCIIEEK